MGMALAVRRFTVDEYHRMAEVGILHEDDRVELLDGQIVQMTPIGVAHAASVTRLTHLFAPLAGGRATLRIQSPLIVAEDQEPQPDVALVRYRPDGYGTGHPRAADTLLVIEVADTSLESDRERKIPLYARAGIPETWLANLPGDALEIHREPRVGTYTDVRTARRGDTVSPLAFPNLVLPVHDILG
jgi:Uma2 family endonuclease